tara:strand:+ start:987 stop:1622 length:636 start_codon:yes stop_codon:yes gene_type:complete
MFTKKDIDSFILKEAASHLFEADANVDNVSNLEDAIALAKDTLEKTKESLKNLTEKLKMDKQVQTSATGADYKKMADAQVKITEDQLDLTKELESSAQQRVVDLEGQKAEAEKVASQSLSEQDVESVNVNAKAVSESPKIEKKDIIVRFDTKTNSPFLVKFTDRGFLVGDTRLSFGLIEKAISKQFSLTLKNGLILTPVKMQKILKYKNRY